MLAVTASDELHEPFINRVFLKSCQAACSDASIYHFSPQRRQEREENIKNFMFFVALPHAFRGVAVPI